MPYGDLGTARTLRNMGRACSVAGDALCTAGEASDCPAAPSPVKPPPSADVVLAEAFVAPPDDVSCSRQSGTHELGQDLPWTRAAGKKLNFLLCSSMHGYEHQ